VQSKDDESALSTTWNQQLKSEKMSMFRSIGKQSGESMESVLKKKRKGFAEKESFKPGMK